MTEQLEPPPGNRWPIEPMHRAAKLLLEAQTILEANDMCSAGMAVSFDALFDEIDRCVCDMTEANR